MTLLVMRYFIKVAECMNFTKAAESLYVSQPTLSRQISDLEEELNVELFDRSKRTLKLTKAGEIFLREATEIIARCDQIPKLVTDISVTMNLSVGYHGALNSSILEEALARCMKRYPGIAFHLKYCNFSELNRGLEDDSLDIVITNEMCVEGIPNLVYHHVQNTTLCAAVSINHRFANQDEIALSELKDETFILVNRDSSPITVDNAKMLCSAAGFVPNVAKTYPDGHTLMMMVGANEGISLVFSNIDIPSSVKLLNIYDPQSNFSFDAIYKSQNKNPAIQLFTRVLDTVVSEYEA